MRLPRFRVRTLSIAVGVLAILLGGGQTLASGDFGGNVLIREAATGQLLRTLRAHETRIRGLWPTVPTAGLLATGGRDQTIRLWQAGPGPPLDRRQ